MLQNRISQRRDARAVGGGECTQVEGRVEVEVEGQACGERKEEETGECEEEMEACVVGGEGHADEGSIVGLGCSRKKGVAVVGDDAGDDCDGGKEMLLMALMVVSVLALR